MGQKINPNGFRVGVNRAYLSSWYAQDKKSYSKYLAQDTKLKGIVKQKLSNAGLASVKILRNINSITVEITVSRPGVVIGRGGAGIETLKKELDRLMKTTVDIKILEAKDPNSIAVLIAKNVGDQIVRRIAPKIAISRELENAKQCRDLKGLRIAVSGRIKGAEIARTEKAQFGTIPLQTLRADIDYAFEYFQVPNAGIQGIKVWAYKGEKMGYE